MDVSDFYAHNYPEVVRVELVELSLSRVVDAHTSHGDKVLCHLSDTTQHLVTP